MGADLNLDPDELRGVANDLTAVAGTMVQLTRHLQQCTGTAAHFGAPDTEGQLGVGFAAGREDLLTGLTRAGQLASALVDELRASVDRVVAADQHSAQQLQAAGEGMA